MALVTALIAAAVAFVDKAVAVAPDTDSGLRDLLPVDLACEPPAMLSSSFFSSLTPGGVRD
jgi:hypothetical protein